MLKFILPSFAAIFAVNLDHPSMLNFGALYLELSLGSSKHLPLRLGTILLPK
jgi:hypothetical protein